MIRTLMKTVPLKSLRHGPQTDLTRVRARGRGACRTSLCGIVVVVYCSVTSCSVTICRLL